jgi:hypothetical protein
MEALATLADGAGGVRAVGFVEYFEEFFDVIPDDERYEWRTSCFTDAEVRAVEAVLTELLAANDVTPNLTDDDGFIATGWPDHIAPLARAALDIMLGRGRFREDVEEPEPSGP